MKLSIDRYRLRLVTLKVFKHASRNVSETRISQYKYIKVPRGNLLRFAKGMENKCNYE